MVEMFFKVDALADTTIPEQYTLQLKYADNTFAPWNPYATRVITVATPIDPANHVYESVESASITFYQDEGQNAVDYLNTFFGYPKFTLSMLLTTDTETWLQIQEDVAVVNLALSNGLANKAEVIHTHILNDIEDAQQAVNNYVYELRNQPNGVPALDSNAMLPVSYISNLPMSSVSGLSTALSGKAAAVHTHAYADLTGKPTIPVITTQAHINDASNNAATNAPTNLNVLTTLVGTLTGEVNATNTKQNDLATKYNDLATKFNTLLDRLEANNLLAAS